MALTPSKLARVGDVMIKNVDTLAASMPIDEAVEFFTTAGPRHESYPVVERPDQCLFAGARTGPDSSPARSAPEGPQQTIR
jgi:hypothetical protein